MDQRQPPPPPLEESMRELTLEDGRRPDPGPRCSSSTSSMTTMDLDDAYGGGATGSRRGRDTLAGVPAVAAPPEGAPAVGAVGHGHREAHRGVPPPPPPPPQPQVNTQAARARDVEEILRDMLPEGSVLVGYTINGYLFS